MHISENNKEYDSSNLGSSSDDDGSMGWIEETGEKEFRIKSKDENDIRGWRPITLSSFLIKGLERTILWKVTTTTLTRNPLSKYQHAFRPNYSCDTAISDTVDILERELLRKQKVLGISLDIKGAFDNIDINKALVNLKKKGIAHWILKWYRYYLFNRKSIITINDITIAIKHTKGMPQGGVLSTLLWNILFDELLLMLNIK